MRSLWCGVTDKVADQPQHIFIASQVYKWVKAVALFRVDKVKHFDIVALFFKQAARVAEYLAFRVKHDERGVCLHDIWFGKEAGFARAAAADHHDVQVSVVLSAVKPDAGILREYDILLFILIRILFAELPCVAPFCAAVFLAAPVIATGGKIHADAHAIDNKEYENGFHGVGAPRYFYRVIHAGGETRNDTR